MTSEAVTLLTPLYPAVEALENASCRLVIHHSDVHRARVLNISRVRRYLTRGKTIVRRLKRRPAVLAAVYAAAIGRNQNMIRVPWIDIDIVHNDVIRRQTVPLCSRVGRLVQTFSRPGKDDLQMRRILIQLPCSPCRGRDALHFREVRTRIGAFINARTCACVDDLRVLRVYDDRKDVRIINDAFFNIAPGRAAVGGLPWQMPRSGIDHVRVSRIDRDRLHLFDFGTALGTDLFPVHAVINAEKNSPQRSGNQFLIVGGRTRQRPNRLAAHFRLAIPVLSVIVADENPAIRSGCRESSHNQSLRIFRIHYDMVDNKVVALGNLRHPLPLRPAVMRVVDPARGRP